MDYTAAQTLITDTVTAFGNSTIAILTAIIAVAVGLLVFRWGWRKVRGVAK